MKADVDHYILDDGDRVLLCTDGLNDMVEDEEIAAILDRHPAPADACDALIALALERGGKDNVTVVVARYQLEDEQSPAGEATWRPRDRRDRSRLTVDAASGMATDDDRRPGRILRSISASPCHRSVVHGFAAGPALPSRLRIASLIRSRPGSGMASISSAESLPSLFLSNRPSRSLSASGIGKPSRRPGSRPSASARRAGPPRPGRRPRRAPRRGRCRSSRRSCRRSAGLLGDDLDAQQAHLVGGLLAPADALRRVARVPGVVGRVVVVGVELDDRPLGQRDGRPGTGTGPAS